MISMMCSCPGCSRAAEEGKKYCARHAASAGQSGIAFSGCGRKASRAWQRLYRTARWKKMRQRFLEAHPYCAYCGAPATEADHARAHKGDLELFYSEENLQPLCKACHSAKTLRENGNFNRKARRHG